MGKTHSEKQSGTTSEVGLIDYRKDKATVAARKRSAEVWDEYQAFAKKVRDFKHV